MTLASCPEVWLTIANYFAEAQTISAVIADPGRRLRVRKLYVHAGLNRMDRMSTHFRTVNTFLHSALRLHVPEVG
jgi:hypothetical protein